MRYVETLDAVPVADLVGYPGNARVHAEDVLRESARTNGQYRAVVARRRDDGSLEILAGHGTRSAFASIGAASLRVEVIECDDEEAARIVLVDNRGSDLATYDDAALLALLTSLTDTDDELLGTGYDAADLAALLASLEDAAGEGGGTGGTPLAERYGVPPFSILDGRSGPWQDRKREWLDLGIKSEVGRGGNLAFKGQDSLNGLLMAAPSASDPAFYAKKRAVEARLGRTITTAVFQEEHWVAPEGGGLSATGTSVFDPVVCELAYRWFCPTGGAVLDPFAGGSVRGIVAAALGHPYTGIDLSAAQVEADREQAGEIVPRLAAPAPVPTWLVGDSTAADALLPRDAEYDFVFSCPPYADLERYSDDPADLSNLTYPEFRAAHAAVIRQAVARLRPDRFAAWVVGEVRAPDGGGSYRGLVPDTIAAFIAAGCTYYNELILVTPVGSLPIRAARQFDATRKIGKTHQNVLVFAKGDPRKAAAGCAPTPAVDLPAAEAD